MTNEEYVEAQRKVNFYHNNGQIEHLDEGTIEDVYKLWVWLQGKAYTCSSILDAGCRTGYAMEAMTSLFPQADIEGVDIVPEFVEIANERADTIVGDIQDLPFEDNSFDWVFCVASIEHCQDVKKAAQELKRVAKVGIYVVTDLEGEESFANNPSHFYHNEDPCEWVDIFREDGWRLQQLLVPNPKRLDMIWTYEGGG